MSDRINKLIVVLDRDYKDEDVRVIVDAINMIKGVQHTTSDPVNPTDYAARVRVVTRLQDTILGAFKSELNLT